MDSPSYYAILPANVRYDKNLKPMEKILYAEITALSNKDGYCSASNSYFAKLYGKSTETVSRWISNLEKEGYLNVIIETKKGNLRKIYPIDKKINSIDKNVNTLLTKKSRPIDENVKHNNINTILQDSININNKKNNNTTSEKETFSKKESASKSEKTSEKEKTSSYSNTDIYKSNTDYSSNTEYNKKNNNTSEKFTIESALKKSNIQQLLNELKVDSAFVYELEYHLKTLNKPIVNEKMLVALLRDIRDASIKLKRSANEILEFMQQYGWKNIKAEWIENVENNKSKRNKKNKSTNLKELEKFGFKFDDEIIDTPLIGGWDG